MEAINIEITKAKITSYTIQLNDDFPVATASIDLLTAQGKVITSYSISSSHWQEHLKFDLPIEMIRPIKEIAATLERIVAQHCQNSAKAIAMTPSDARVVSEETPF